MELLLVDRPNGAGGATQPLISTFENPGSACEVMIIVTATAYLGMEGNASGGFPRPGPPDYIGIEIYLNEEQLGYTRVFTHHIFGIDNEAEHKVLPTFVCAGLGPITTIREGTNRVEISKFTQRTCWDKHDEFVVSWYRL